MGTGKNWSQLLVERVRREQDRALLGEVLKCAKAGALRSAYIMTWVTVAESLKATLREMSLRDHGIQKVVGKMEKFEEQGRSVDRFLLDESIKLGVVPSGFQQKFRHMYELRSIYAHPYEIGPTQEEVRAAIGTAVDGVLSRRPFFRQGYINDRLDALLDNPHFLDDDLPKIEAYGRELADRVDPRLQRYFTERLLCRLEPIVDDPELNTILRRGAGIAIAFICQVDAELSTEEWQVVDLLERWPKAASLIFRDPRIWCRLGEQAQDMTLTLQLLTTQQGAEALEIFVSSLENGRLTLRQKDKVVAAVEQATLRTLANSSVSLAHWADRIVKDLKSYYWYTQNPAINALATAGADRVRTECRDAVQESLGRNVLQAAEGESHDAINFLVRLGSSKSAWPSLFLGGILFEAFLDEAGRIRFKTHQMRNALMGVLRNAGGEAEILMKALVTALRKGQPKHPLGKAEIEEAMKACDSTLSSLLDEEEPRRRLVRTLRRVLKLVPTGENT